MTETLLNLATAVGVLVALVLGFIAWRLRRIRFIAVFPALVMLVALAVAGAAFWLTHRPIPSNEQRILFEGVEYIRDVRPNFEGEDHILIAYVVRIDLDAPGLSLFVTPGQPIGNYEQTARTTSEFLERYGVQVAINGDFFNPFYERDPIRFYPDSGTGINMYGFAMSSGEVYARGFATGAIKTMYISQDNEVSFDNPPPFQAFHAISGNWLLVENGRYNPVDDTTVGDADEQLPRTAVGLDENERTLIMVLVDGRQPNYSEGATFEELASLLIEYGAHTALNFDGGGSVTLVIEDEDGRPQILNSPIHTRIPGRERPVANHLGVFAQRLTSDG
jgi:hypothetical protein